MLTLSNSPAWHAHHHETLAAACSPHLTALYTSYGLGVPAKPDPAAFRLIAARHNVPVERIVAVGDRWSVDVVAALSANVGTIIWTSNDPNECPEPHLIVNGRIHTIEDISGVGPLIERLTRRRGSSVTLLPRPPVRLTADLAPQVTEYIPARRETFGHFAASAD